MNLTIAIPTLNGAPRLSKVLEYLHAQELPPEFSQQGIWEILIVDNNSSDDTAAVVTELQVEWSHGKWGDAVQMRYCFEPQAGSPNARQRAVAEARGAWVGFIDDDNWPDSNWVWSALKFAERNPSLGAFGSRIKAVYEVEPPPNFDRIESFLAIRDHGNAHQFDPEHLQLPPGAGLVVSRQRWLESIPNTTGMLGAKGGVRVSGSDYAELLYMHRLGHGIAYNAEMVIHHAICPHRLERSYLLPLAYSIGLSTCQLRFINARGLRRWEIALRTFVGGLRRIIMRLWQYGPNLRADLNLTFLFCFYMGGMLSPLLAVAPRVGIWLNYQRARSFTHFLLKLWPLPSLSSPPTMSQETSPVPLNPS